MFGTIIALGLIGAFGYFLYTRIKKSKEVRDADPYDEFPGRDIEDS